MKEGVKITISDRSIIFLACTLLSALTLASTGVLEDNNAFQNKIFEKRGQQIANVIDLMVYTDEGYFEKRLPYPMDIEIYSVGLDKNVSIDSRTNREVSFRLESAPTNVNIEGAQYLCVEKLDDPLLLPENEVNVSKGQC